MKERPIIFSAPMVRAILDGRKTQTRRVVKWLDAVSDMSSEEQEARELRGWREWAPGYTAAPAYGAPGDRLWVRENFSVVDEQGPGCYVYRADGQEDLFSWRSSIHMPRRASRITLEIVGVRVERLQDVNEFAAVAEGIERYAGIWKDYSQSSQGWIHPINSYRSLWESIHGAGSWEANPWVWVIVFRRAEHSGGEERG